MEKSGQFVEQIFIASAGKGTALLILLTSSEEQQQKNLVNISKRKTINEAAQQPGFD